MAFEGLSDKLGKVFSKLKNHGKLNEKDVKEAMREVKMALLEADVSFPVVKDFVAKVSERAVGSEVMNSLTPAQQVIDIVHDELIKLMGTDTARIDFPSKPPCVIMMCGLQGAGKTTHTAKLAKYLKKQNRRPLLVACDIYRPAAIDQLKVVGASVDAHVFEMGQTNPVKIAKESIKYAKDNGFAYELITAEKPANVTGFKVKSLTSTNVTLQWNKNANASGYEIEQYKSGKWTNVAKITSNATTSYTVKGLAAGTAGYKFRMRAVKNGAYSDYTSALSVNTNPYGVGGFKCSSKTSTSVTLKWNKGTTASGYQLQQYKDGKWVTIYTGTKATNTSYTVKNLKAGTAGYRFRIRAYKTYGNTKQYGSWSSEVKVNTNPYGVGGFKAKSTAKNSITLGWNKGTTASGYQLQQYKGGKWVTVYTGTKATSTSCTIKSLKANTSYKFRIRAYKTYGNTKQYGSWSKVLTVKTKR